MSFCLYLMMAPSLCELCGLSRQMFSNRLQYSEHFKKHKNEKVPCPECEKHCYSKYQLSNHMQYAHGSVFTCDQCSKAFGTKGNLTRHVINNHKTDCDVACGQFNKTMRQDNYRKNYVTCLKEAYKSTNKKFKCSICQKSFSHKIALKRHMKSHKEEDCHLCNKSFGSKHKSASCINL